MTSEDDFQSVSSDLVDSIEKEILASNRNNEDVVVKDEDIEEEEENDDDDDDDDEEDEEDDDEDDEEEEEDDDQEVSSSDTSAQPSAKRAKRSSMNKTERPLIQKTVFKAIINEMLSTYDADLTISTQALNTLRIVAEQYLSEFFGQAAVLAELNGRQTVSLVDIVALRAIFAKSAQEIDAILQFHRTGMKPVEAQVENAEPASTVI